MKSFIAAIGFAVSFGPAVSAQAQSAIVIKFKDVVAPDAPKGKAVEYFKQPAKHPTDIRADVEPAMADATKYANDISRQQNDNALAAIKNSGSSTFVTSNDDQKAAWRRALLPIYDETAPRIGTDVINEFEHEVKASGTN